MEFRLGAKIGPPEGVCFGLRAEKIWAYEIGGCPNFEAKFRRTWSTSTYFWGG